MALTKQEKNDIVTEVADLLATSKMTVVAKYKGTTVKAMQQLRREARDNATVVKVVKNRLVKKAVEQTKAIKDVDTSALEGMLVYAFNDQDEVAAAQVLANFAKANPTIEFVGAISQEGKFLDTSEVTELSKLASKEELIAGLIHLLNSPVTGVVGALGGDLHGMLKGLEAKAS